ncbi:hypothetical protein KJ819_01710 [Patescibacteria group bacterium]|nr:hypothetical protein [Patescibacteria group bacterium]MBU1501000.1 hypothetical protein [Patescibacteria group bacterium]MBU2080630.1 hypothetical protein [Patescibacteria group bacterium]MBU2124295.1 hypothetical protein [Patescibacteria group bacterium]MBU2194421.1 hypothetical protein [Patescibacteria group bacterium]
MYVIDVIPFAPGAPAGALSYRSTDSLTPGTLVTVPLRKKRVRGLVVACNSVRDAKALIKRADFSLSGNIEVAGMLPEALRKGIEATALYHAAPLGAVYMQLLGALIAEEIPEQLQEGAGHEIVLVEAPYETRIERYRELIQETSGTTLIIVPTLAELARMKESLSSFKPVVLSGAKASATRAHALRKALASPSLVLATPAYIATPIPALQRVILDRVSAGAYRFPKRPYVHAVVAAQYVTEARNIPLTYGDFPLPLEFRSLQPLSDEGLGTLSIVDVKAEEEKQGATFKAIPDPLFESIKEALEKGGRVAVLSARKGYAPAVVCRTCGASVRDAQGRALALATYKGERVLRSADGNTIKEADAVCDVCESWNLLPLGIGVERVMEELAVLFPKTQLIRFDTDTIRTPAMARKTLALFEESGGIIVGTEFILPWLSTSMPLALAVVASADSLLALPFWRSRERFLRLLLTLRERAIHTIVATRRMDESALVGAEHPEEETFFEEERSLRKALEYPPHGALITIATVGNAQHMEAAASSITKMAEPYSVYALPEKQTGTQTSRTWVLQLPEGAWPDQALSRKLSGLPPSFRVLIDPDSLQ